MTHPPQTTGTQLKAIMRELRALRRELSRGQRMGISNPDALIEAALTRLILEANGPHKNRLLGLPLDDLRAFCHDLLDPQLNIADAHRRLRGRCPQAGESRAAYRFADRFRQACESLTAAGPPPHSPSPAKARSGQNCPARERTARGSLASSNPSDSL